MLTYALRRLLATIPVLLIGTFVVFYLVSSVNDPRDRLATCVLCDDSALERLVELYELDDPIPVRYANWLGDFVQGDLGTSTSRGESEVSSFFWERAKNTALVAVPAFIIVATTALALSIYSAIRQYSFGDYFFTSLSFLGIAMPTFFFGLVLQVFWGIWWQDWTGTKPFWVTGKHNENFVDLLSSVTLPVVTLAIIFVAAESRFGRAAMLEVVNADYIRTARAKGISERRVVLKHVLRNAMIPLVTIWALDFAALLGGSVITETVFSWPGLGPLLLDGIFGQDLDLVMAIVMLASLVAISFNLLADVLYGVLDPRIRYD